MKSGRWSLLAICLLLIWSVSACERQEGVATAPPADRSTAATEPAAKIKPPAPPEAPAATTEQKPPATADSQPSARPADEFMGQAPAHGPETVVLTAKNGNVTFKHAQHAARLECKTCHGAGTPVAINLDRDSAHKPCRGCHEERGAGPVKCAECHVKK
jgi:CubicO group peptidase (beta-lactamase class C family)